MVKISEILADASQEVLDKIKEIINEKDDIRLREYLNSLINAPKKIESKVKKPAKTIKICSGKKVLAHFNIADYDWVKYKGLKTKSIPYAGMILKLNPNDVYGVSRVVDSLGKYKVIMPTYKKQSISLDKDIVELMKARSKPFGGNILMLFQTTAERKPEEVLERIHDVKASKIERIKIENGSIKFDSVGGGLSTDINPYNGRFGGKKCHRLGINCYSSGSVDYIQEISDADIESYKNAEEKEKYDLEDKVIENNQSLIKEIDKICNKFDKDIEALLKKYGFKKEK